MTAFLSRLLLPGSQALVSLVLERELPSESFSLVAEEVNMYIFADKETGRNCFIFFL